MAAFALIHSPLVGPLTWKFVAHKLEQEGHQTIVPVLVDSGPEVAPFWRQHAESAANLINNLHLPSGCILVGHSGAGPLLPLIGCQLHQTPDAYVFVDAMLPRHEWSRLDLIRMESEEWSAELERHLRNGGRFPTWTAADLEQVLPDENLREQVLKEVNARELAFFTEPIPVPSGWGKSRNSYIQFTGTYEVYATQARQSGWPTVQLSAGHFHMLIDPQVVADVIMQLAG